MPSHELARVGRPGGMQISDDLPWTPKQVDIIKASIISYGSEPATDEELWLFGQVCKRTGKDPFTRKIYAIKRFDSKMKAATNGRVTEKMTIQIGIDGLREQASKTKRYGGQLGPFWTDGSKDANGQVIWADLWTKRGAAGEIVPPFAAKVGIVMVGSPEPYWGVAQWTAFAPYHKKKIGFGPNQTEIMELSPMWKKMPDNQLAKCAEAQGLRKAAPEDCGDLYIGEEMEQAANEIVKKETVPLITALRHERDLIGWEVWKALKLKVLGKDRAELVLRFQDMDEREQELMLEAVAVWKGRGEPARPPALEATMPTQFQENPRLGKPGDKLTLKESMSRKLEQQNNKGDVLTWIWCPRGCGQPIFFENDTQDGVTNRIPIDDCGQIHDCQKGATQGQLIK